MTTVYDVARAAAVSTATVSRVLHHQDRVGPETRERVLKMIAELGFVPNAAAQSLSRRRRDLIGLVVVERDLDTPFDIEETSLLYPDLIVRGAEYALRDTGSSLLLAFLSSNEATFGRIRSLSAKVDGLLISEGILPEASLEELARRVPIVVLAGQYEGGGLDVVAVDNVAGIGALVAHLIDAHSCRRLHFIAGPPDAPDARQRFEGFRAVVASHRGARIVGTGQGDFSERSGARAARDLLAFPAAVALPEAVVCANDQMAVGLIRELEAAGVSVPGQVAVVGFDDLYPSRLLNPPLTTVRQPMRELGTRGVARLLERIANPTQPSRVEVLPTELVIRASCGCPVGVDSDKTRGHRGKGLATPSLTAGYPKRDSELPARDPAASKRR